MKQSFRKIFGAASAVFLIGLFVAAAPVRAGSTDERIKALDAELQQLKAEQQRVKQEQSQIKEDALAAKSKLPSFRYRPGSGLRIRGADRSWEYRVTGEFSAYMTFHGGGGRSISDEDDSGPTQGGLFGRHMQWGHFARLYNGLYDFGFNMKFDRGGSGTARSSGQRANVRFSTWSPYYPDFQWLNVRNGYYSRYTRVSSSSGSVIEREPNYDGFLSTGSSKGAGLHWSDVPVGPAEVGFVVNYQSGNDQFARRMTQDPLPQKGVAIGLSVDPLKKSKNKYLKGLNFRFNYVNVHDDDNRDGGDNGQMQVRNRMRTNRATIFAMSTRGRHSYIEPSIDYRVGPFNIGYVWSRQVGEQRRTGGCAAKEGFDEEADALDESGALFVPTDGTQIVGQPDISSRTSAEEDQAALRVAEAAACNNFSDARITNNLISMGAFIWGPKGFMTGSRNSGVRLTYTHNRVFMDAGSGWNAGEGGEPLGSAETENEFDHMRRWHMLENIVLLRWYQHRNLTWAIQFDFNSISKMKGTARAEDTRRRLGILEDGGTYQQITLHTKWSF